MKKLTLITIALIFASFGAFAQNFRTGYFLDGYMYKYQLNPAFQGERGFFSLPGVGGVSVGVESNLAYGTFVYPADNQMVTFLHPSISDETFMSKIKQDNPVNANLDMNLLAVGFRVKNTYHTIDLSLKGNVHAALPGDMFRFLKVGGSDGNPVYDFSSLNLDLSVYSQIAYGFSIKIKDFMSVGVRAKFLLGLQAVQSNIDALQLSLQPDKWTVNAGGHIVASSLAAGYLNGNLGDVQSEIKAMFKNPGFGAAFDLGVSFDFLKHFTVSASVLDLGFIYWKNLSKLGIVNNSWEYAGFDDITTGEGNDMNAQLDAQLEELKSAFQYEDMGTVDKHIQKLGITTMLGLEFRFPFYNRMSIGALGTHRFEGPNSWTEGRFSFNYAPFRWFSLAANYAISTFGHSYGAALNIHPAGYNLFVGVDSFKPLLNVTPKFIPIDDWNTNVKVGITFPFGKYNGRYPKTEKAKSKKRAAAN